MAGEWLKMEACTPEKSEVLAITAKMGWDDTDLTVGKLFRIWRWFDQQTTDGDRRMQQDAMRFARGTLALCPGLAGTRLSAITDFAYNTGLGALQASTLRRKVNAGEWDEAKVQLMRWVRGGGRVLPGLVRRRKAEAELI